MFNRRFVYSFFLACTLTACGGGGGGSSTPPPSNNPGTPSQPSTSDRDIINNGLARTEQELEHAAKRIVNASYSGSQTPADMSMTNVLEHYDIIIGNTQVNIIDIALDSALDFELSSATSFTAACGYRGNMAIATKFNNDTEGNLTIKFNQCRPNTETTITGQMTLVISENTSSFISMSAYFSDVGVRLDDDVITMNGVIQTRFPTNGITPSNSENQTMYLHFSRVGKPDMLLDSSATMSGNTQFGLMYSGNGRLYVADAGYVDFNYSNFADLSPYSTLGSVTFTGSQKARFTHEMASNGQNVIRLELDENNDGTYDTGTYFSSPNALIEADPLTLVLVPIADMSIPPSPYYPNFINYLATAETPIQVYSNGGLASDPDTPENELTFSFRWYLNGQELTEYTGDTLPAGIAVYGDTVAVSIVASDGGTPIVGPQSSIALSDTPPQLRFSNAPTSATLGETVMFSVSLVDPDLGSNQTIPVQLSGPEGAIIGDDGAIEWTVPESQLFPTQFYTFTVTAPGSSLVEGEFIHSIEVHSTESNLNTLSKFSLMEDASLIAKGDFDGDGQVELAISSSNGLINIFKYQNGDFTLAWHTAFNYGVQDVSRIYAEDIDEDGADEIIVASSNKIVILNAFQHIDTIVNTIDYSDYENRLLADINNDGVPEIFYVEDNYSASSYRGDLVMAYLSSPDNAQIIGSVTERVNMIKVGNVDNDSALELVTNTGTIIDLATMSNQWMSSVPFGDSLLELVDVDNDGVKEIIGNDSSLYLYLYSATAQTQTQLDFNEGYCDLMVADVTNDERPELLMSPCYGNTPVIGVDLANGNLETVWEYTPPGEQFENVYFMALDDFDGDNADELIVSISDRYSAPKSFYSLDITSGNNELKQYNNFVEFESINALGWHSADGVNDSPVFALTTNDYELNRQFIWWDINNQTVNSPRFSSSSFQDVHHSLADINGDRVSEILLGANGYDSGMVAKQITNAADLYSYQSSGFFSPTGTRVVDFDQDGQLEYLALHDNVMALYEVMEPSPIATRTLSTYVNDWLIDDAGAISYVYVSQYNRISVLTQNTNAFAELSFLDVNCRRIFLLNDDTDPQAELGCVEDSYGDDSTINIYNNDGGTLTLKRQMTLPITGIDEVIADPTSTNEQSFLVYFTVNDQSFSYNSPATRSIGYISRDGKLIWRSAGLLNATQDANLRAKQNASGKLELIFNTFTIGYWVKQ